MPKTVKKRIAELFETENGNSKYTKAFCKDHAGEYIVYTGTTIGVFAKVNFADYTTPNLTFTTDGEKAGTIEYITDSGYCIGGHRTVLKPIVNNLNLLYFKYLLQPLFYKNVKRGDVPSLHFNNIKNLEIEVPVLSDGNYDLATQTELAKKYQDIDNQRKRLIEKAEELKKLKIYIEEDKTIQYKMVSLNDIVTHYNGNANYTKEWCNLHIGTIPVYSANNKEPFAYSSVADYDGKFLTYSKNGCAGYIKIIDGEFSINGDRCVLKLNPGFEKVNLQYLKYYLEPIFRKNIKGRIGINGKNEYTKINSTMIKKLNIFIPFPIDDSGIFDTEKQQELAMKYATIETIKGNIYNQVYSLTNIIIN